MTTTAATTTLTAGVVTTAAATDARMATPVTVEWHMGSLMVWHVTAAESGGQLALGEVVVRQGGEPPMHIHAREDEVWYVIDGSILFQRGHERILAGPGSTVVLPRGIPHGFAVQTAQARILHAYTPAGIEAAFRALSVPAAARELPPPGPPPDDAFLQRLSEVYGAHGVTFIGPPLAVVLAREHQA